MAQVDLFRSEVMEAHSGRWLGSVRLAQSIPFWAGCFIAMALACSLVAYGVFGTYARKAHVSGALVSGELISTPLVAHLYAPSRTADFVAVGQTVLIRYTAYPYQKFGLQSGKIVTISQNAFLPSSLPTTLKTPCGLQDKQALYLITVALGAQYLTTYGKVYQLKTGMTLEADIVQDRRTIIEWMLKPMFAALRRAST